MKTSKQFMFLLLGSFAISGFKSLDEIPGGWFKAGDVPDSYRMGLDSKVFSHGQKSATIESLVTEINGFTTLMQTCYALHYAGKRIKMTGYIRSENVAGWSGMWLRIDAKTGQDFLGFDNMEDRPVQGTSDWTKCEIIMDVPPESGTLNFGVLLAGTGKIWFDNVTFEVVNSLAAGETIEIEATIEQKKPLNLDFEE